MSSSKSSQAYYNSGSRRATCNGEGGGVLLNQAPHNPDLWQWIFGMPKRVRAFCDFGKYHNIGVEDDVTIFGEYENGATATFISTTGDACGTNRLEITGDRGKIVVEHGKLCHRLLLFLFLSLSLCTDRQKLWLNASGFFLENCANISFGFFSICILLALWCSLLYQLFASQYFLIIYEKKSDKFIKILIVNSSVVTKNVI